MDGHRHRGWFAGRRRRHGEEGRWRRSTAAAGSLDLPALVARLRLLCGEVLTDVIHEFRLGNTAIIQIDVFQISHVEAVVDGADDANNVGLAILDGDPLANAGLCMWFIADCAILDDSTVD